MKVETISEKQLIPENFIIGYDHKWKNKIQITLKKMVTGIDSKLSQGFKISLNINLLIGLLVQFMKKYRLLSRKNLQNKSPFSAGI